MSPHPSTTREPVADVTGRQGGPIQDGTDEGGAVAVIVAICLLLLFGAGAIAIDLGSAWQTKRDLVVDTDAAALAGAKAMAAGEDCESAAAEYISANLGVTVTAEELEAANQAVDLCDEASGVVTVRWTTEAQQTLSGAISSGDLTVLAQSMARIKDDYPGGGLRPMSVCMENPEIQAWIAGDGNADGQGGSDADGEIPDSPNEHTLGFDKSWNPTDGPCGGASGNWGWVCFQKKEYNADSCNPNGTAAMLLQGYTGVVDLVTTDPADGDCDAVEDGRQPCDPMTGSTNANKVEQALNDLVCDRDLPARECPYQFSVLGISSFAGNGSTATFTPSAFVGVVLRDWTLHGSSGDFTYELVNLFDDGTSAVVRDGVLDDTTIVICGGDGGSVCE